MKHSKKQLRRKYKKLQLKYKKLKKKNVKLQQKYYNYTFEIIEVPRCPMFTNKN